MTLVLVVDDVAALAEQYAYDLQRVGGYETLVAGGGKKALEILSEEAVDCVILDLEMPGVDGFDVLREAKQRKIDVPIIVYTGTGNYDRCAQAIRLGAYSFIDKAEPMERVVREVENASEQRRLQAEVRSLQKQLGDETPLIGSGPAMLELRSTIARVAPIPSPALIVGESGSGKELVARELHRLGPGTSEPFVAINSAALPENLVESELFGHERGAFTGASRTRKGAFEAAGRGTLFLDEVGDLPPAAQAKLLRVLEERKVTRLGANRTVEAPARVVAATHRDLESEVSEGRFRQDLYYRLGVHVLRVPPLRERLSDLPELVDHLILHTCARFGVRPKKLDGDALDRLMAYDWKKNNVRELRNVVERMIIASEGETLTSADVPPEIVDGAPLPTEAKGGGRGGRGGRTFQQLKAEAERQIILAALHRNDWHITRSAEELALADHSSLLKIMRRHGIKRD
ncbi:MAG: sigma-54 dependent transcriptional regulator [Candidatus Palauibacterales bacterium]|nr:sigma-54 dependent transcriptional regulator [Candidatus Palauibacterales bacterium]